MGPADSVRIPVGGPRNRLAVFLLGVGLLAGPCPGVGSEVGSLDISEQHANGTAASEAAPVESLPFVQLHGVAGPLSAGLDTFPMGVAYLSGASLPDLFVLNSRKHSPLAPAGVFLYEFVRETPEGAPVFRKHARGAVAAPGGVPTDLLHGAVTQLASGEVVGIWVVREKGTTDVLRSYFNPAAHSFMDKVTQLDLRPPPSPPHAPAGASAAWTRAWLLPCAPKVGRSHCTFPHGGDLLLEHVDPPSNRAPADAAFTPYSAQGIWRGGATPVASLYHVRLHGPGKGKTHSPRLATQSVHARQPYSYCGLALLPSLPGGGGDGGGAEPLEPSASGRRSRKRRRAPERETAPGAGAPPLLLVGGSTLGVLNAYALAFVAPGGSGSRRRNDRDRPVRITRRGPLRRAANGTRGSEGSDVVKHPSIQAVVVAYPAARSAGAVGAPQPHHLLAGGEGALYFYRQALAQAPGGAPVFAPPVPVLETGALAYGGSLPTPAVGDWDGDGTLDVLVGNSEGRVLLFRNRAQHGFRLEAGVPLRAAGEEIHVQLFWTIQGPDEARYGYTSPVLVDWNQDGLLDVLLGDATQLYQVFLNEGIATAPRLGPGRRLEVDGAPLRGMWRVRPGVARMPGLGGALAMVVVDEGEALRAYYRLGDTALLDGGRLQLEGGYPIYSSFLKWAGSAGRLSVLLYDFDLDGALDLVLGTHKMSAVPSAERGLPRSLPGQPGGAVLFLQGVPDNSGAGRPGGQRPPLGVRFRFPEVLRYEGKPVFFGSHRCSPEVVEMTVDGVRGPHLLVGEEAGRMVLLMRSKLSVEAAYPEGFPMEDAKRIDRTPELSPEVDLFEALKDQDAVDLPEPQPTLPITAPATATDSSSVSEANAEHAHIIPFSPPPVISLSDASMPMESFIFGVLCTLLVVVMVRPLRHRFCAVHNTAAGAQSH